MADEYLHPLEFSNVIPFKLLHFLNANVPIEVTVLEIVIFSILAHPSNALLPILVPPDIISVLRLEGTVEFEYAPNIYPNTVLLDPPEVDCPTNGIDRVSRLSHFSNAPKPMLAMLS